MRKIILLSFLILFSCSKEDSGVDSANQALIASLNAQISALNAQISAMNSEISALQSKIAENSSLESQLNDVISQLNDAQDALEESNSLLSQKTLDLEDAENTILNLVDTLDRLNRQVALLDLSIVLWIERAAGFYEFEYYENNVYVGTFAWEIGLTENNDIIWNTYYLSGNCYVKNSNASYGDGAEFFFTEVSFDDLGVGAYNVDGETVGLPDYDKVLLVESYTIDLSGGLEVMLSVYDYNQNLIRTIVNDGSSLEKKIKSQLVYSFCSNNGISGSTNNQDTSDGTENQETSASESNNSDSSTTDNQSNVTDSPYIFLDSNGVTIKAGLEAKIGDSAVINGYTYTIVSEDELRNKIINGDDLTYLVTSKILDMSYLFVNKNAVNGIWYPDNFTPYDINGDISSWDVSNVNNMRYMFWKNENFNQNIFYWNVDSLIRMDYMFAYSNFNGDISSWNTSNVTDMTGVFRNSNFNGDISSWNTSNVESMASMFHNNLYFNGDISSWDVSSVIYLSSMFERTFNFNGNISSWDVSKAQKMKDMFKNSTFNQDISSWNTSNVTLMWSMFEGSTFNQDISSWDVSNVTNMIYMFKDNEGFNQNLSLWSVSNVSSCWGFSRNAGNWLAEKPNFTNCDPS